LGVPSKLKLSEAFSFRLVACLGLLPQNWTFSSLSPFKSTLKAGLFSQEPLGSPKQTALFQCKHVSPLSFSSQAVVGDIGRSDNLRRESCG
jgi:hypothetical protein